MTKANILKVKELAEIYAEKKDMNKGEAEKHLKDVFATLGDIVVEYGSGFVFGNIGTLEVNLIEAKDHKRRNPSTGEEFMQHVEKHYAPKFKLSGGKTGVKAKLKELDTE